jgi:hypothetical protein
MAFTVYVPAGAVKLNVPSGFAVTEATTAFVPSCKLTVTGLPAITFPVRDPLGRGVGEATGVKVNVGVGDSTGVDVSVGVGDSTGEGVDVGVDDSTGVEVDVGDSTGVGPVGVGDETGVGEERGVGEGVPPTMVRLVPVEGRSVRRLSPLETRAVH